MSSQDFNSGFNVMNVKEEVLSGDELGEEYIQDLRPTDTQIIVVDSEKVDYHNTNSTSYAEDNLLCRDSDVRTVPTIQHVDIMQEGIGNDLNELYNDLMKCERDCGTCQMYLKTLIEHIRSSHGHSQPTRDPLLIDHDSPLLDQSSFNPVKCEVDEDMGNAEYSEQESEPKCESGPNFELEKGNENDPDCTASFHSSQIVDPKGLTSDNTSSNSKRTQVSGKSYKCDVCEKSFFKKSNLTTHKRIHTGERQFKCDLCEKTFSNLENLNCHKSVHTGEKSNICDVCGKNFFKKSNLTSHMRIHTGERPFKCDLCEKSFTTLDTLTKHRRMHTGEKPFQCDRCAQSFTQKCHLTVHIRIHSGERSYQSKTKCKSGPNFELEKVNENDPDYTPSSHSSQIVDRKGLTSDNTSSNSKRTQVSGKSYKCDVCEKTFASLENLNCHKSVHTGEKSNTCDVCGKSFFKKSNLTSHMRIHTGERPFKCDLCEKSFTTLDTLTKHRRLHTGEKPFICDRCGQSFTQKPHLTLHKRIHSGERSYQCDECGKSFVRSTHLTRHKKIHTGNTSLE